jgi:uridine kinase
MLSRTLPMTVVGGAQRSSEPNHRSLRVRVGASPPAEVLAGTLVRDLLPRHVGDSLVVAGLLDNKTVSLASPLYTGGDLAPLSLSHWEGQLVYRRSLGLAVLEAGRRIEPGLPLKLGPSQGFGRRIDVADGRPLPPAFAERLREAVAALVVEDVPFLEELWPAEEACAHFAEQGWQGLSALVRLMRDPAVPVAACGRVHALRLGPFVPSTGCLSRAPVILHEGALYLVYGDARQGQAPMSTAQFVAYSVGPGRASDMSAQHDRWLRGLGVTSVGAFNELCLGAGLSEIVRVAEGFHEKRIGRIADEIAERGEKARVICVAGPSSSGKTTFIKRLVTQLEVNGVTARALSLDDYFVDRGRAPRDAEGASDYEGLASLDLPLLQGHVLQLLEGRTVRTARYDFVAGASDRHGGPELTLRPGDALLLEGLHALNPRLLAGVWPDTSAFRVLAYPATALPFDPLSHVSLSDVRLLRRIVRDRRRRAIAPADNIARWPSVRRGERANVFPYLGLADAVFDTSLVYEPAVIKVFAERYLLEVPASHPSYVTAHRLRQLLDNFVAVYPEHVPPTSLLREFIGGSSFDR